MGVFKPDLLDLENQYFSSFFGIFEQRGQFLTKYETKMIVIELCGSISPSFSSPEPNFATSTSKRSTICQNDYNPPKEPVYDQGRNSLNRLNRLNRLKIVKMTKKH